MSLIYAILKTFLFFTNYMTFYFSWTSTQTFIDSPYRYIDRERERKGEWEREREREKERNRESEIKSITRKAPGRIKMYVHSNVFKEF